MYDPYDLALLADGYDAAMAMMVQAHSTNVLSNGGFKYLSTSAIADRRNLFHQVRVHEPVTSTKFSKIVRPLVSPMRDWTAYETRKTWGAPNPHATKTRAIPFSDVAGWSTFLDEQFPDWKEGTPLDIPAFSARKPKDDFPGVYVYEVEPGVYKIGHGSRTLQRLYAQNNGQYRPFKVQAVIPLDTTRHTSSVAQEAYIHGRLTHYHLPSLGSGTSTECYGMTEDDLRSFLWQLMDEGHCVLLTAGHAVDDIRKMIY